MNRRQVERLEELRNGINSALGDIVEDVYASHLRGEQTPNIERAGMEEVMEMEEPIKSYEQPIPMPRNNTDSLAPYEVTIKQVNNGFIVNVGCQTFVFESIDKISGYMKEYFTKPSETIEKHYAGKLFNS